MTIRGVALVSSAFAVRCVWACVFLRVCDCPVGCAVCSTCVRLQAHLCMTSSSCTASRCTLTPQVRAVRLRRDRIVIALEHKVLIYNFADLHLLQSIETLPNPLGLLALSSAPEQNVLATPGLHHGQVRVCVDMMCVEMMMCVGMMCACVCGVHNIWCYLCSVCRQVAHIATHNYPPCTHYTSREVGSNPPLISS